MPAVFIVDTAFVSAPPAPTSTSPTAEVMTSSHEPSPMPARVMFATRTTDAATAAMNVNMPTPGMRIARAASAMPM